MADLPGWPLLSPLKVQMQKCEKCSKEFCSPINYRRHIRVHRRTLNIDKVCLLSCNYDFLLICATSFEVLFKISTLASFKFIHFHVFTEFSALFLFILFIFCSIIYYFLSCLMLVYIL